MKQLFTILLIILGFASCTPVRYVYIDPKDSVVKKQRIYYDFNYVPIYNYWWYRPYYNPVIIQRQRPIVIPQRPQQPKMPPRPSRFGPLAPTPRPHK